MPDPNTFISFTPSGGNIGRIHWANGDPALGLRERVNRYLANKWGIRCPAYGKPPTAPFGRVWWEEDSKLPEFTPAPAEWTPAKLPGLVCWVSADDGVHVDPETGQRFLRDLSGNGERMIVGDEVIKTILYFSDNA
jgi:hypothetical protein